MLAGCGLPEPSTRVVQQEIVGGSQDAGAQINDVFLVAMTFNSGANMDDWNQLRRTIFNLDGNG